MRALVRAAVLALASLVCAFAAATASLVTFNLSLPPSDEAYGEPLSKLWSNPAVSWTASSVAFGGAAVGFAVACWALRKAEIWRSIVVVITVTVIAGALLGPLSLCGAPLTLLAGILSIFWCRRVFDRSRAG